MPLYLCLPAVLPFYFGAVGAEPGILKYLGTKSSAGAYGPQTVVGGVILIILTFSLACFLCRRFQRFANRYSKNHPYPDVDG